MARIIILNGPAGAGKTTLSKLLAKQFSKSVVIEVDEIRHMIKSGYVPPFTKRGYSQLLLSTKNVCAIAKNFVDDGFNVIIDDCFTGKKRFDLYINRLKRYDLKTVLLLPDKRILSMRDGKRKGGSKMGERALALHDKLTARMPEEKRWIVVDNSQLTPRQTLNRVLKI